MRHKADVPDISAFGAHGGCLSAFQRAYPMAPSPWYDLSTGVNPFHYPFNGHFASSLCALPEAEKLDALRHAAAQAYDSCAEDIVAAPGTQTIIGLMPYLLAPPRVYIEAPTYSGHEESWHGAHIQCESRSDLMNTQIDPGCTYILCRPNNPDGRRNTILELQDFATHVQGHDGTLVIDASFADFEFENVSEIVQNPAVIMLRSFGKTFGLAGLRLGFAVSKHPVMKRLAVALGPWPLHGSALSIGTEALNDKTWRRETAKKLLANQQRLQEMMSSAGLTYLGGTHLFSLFSHRNAPNLWHRCAINGVATRRFRDRADWLRLGTPGDEDAFYRVRTALSKAFR